MYLSSKNQGEQVRIGLKKLCCFSNKINQENIWHINQIDKRIFIISLITAQNLILIAALRFIELYI